MVSMARASEIGIVEFLFQELTIANATGDRTHSAAKRGTDTNSDECDCAELEEFPCWECVRTGRKNLPNDTE